MIIAGHLYTSLFRAFALILLALTLTNCRTGQLTDHLYSNFQTEKLDTFGISLAYPDGWYVTQDRYFHFKAYGFTPNNLPASIEYRGLDDQKPMDALQKEQYATGWYEAIAKSYPEWKYDLKRKLVDDPEGGFEFEGSYKVATDVHRKIGKLRFRGGKVHAIYYTTHDLEFEKARPLFMNMDARIEYFN
jgi:hypothetical protein